MGIKERRDRQKLGETNLQKNIPGLKELRKILEYNKPKNCLNTVNYLKALCWANSDEPIEKYKGLRAIDAIENGEDPGTAVKRMEEVS